MKIEEASILLPKFNPADSELWADLGCGSGTFTYGLAQQLSKGSKIIAVDRSRQNLLASYNDVKIDFIRSDFENGNLKIPHLDGVLMVNAFHYVKNKIKLIQNLRQCFLSQREKWIIVEYDQRIASRWEPYPIPFNELKLLFRKLDGYRIEKTGERKSVFGGTMYAALITKD